MQTSSTPITPSTSSNSRLFKHKPFLLFFGASGFSELAYQIAFVALGWQVYALSGSAFDLGLIGLIQFLPSVLLVFVIGHAADKYPRRPLVQICQLIEAATALYLAVGSICGWLSVMNIFVSVGVLGMAMAFEGPAATALLPAVVPEGHLKEGTTVGSAIYQMGAISGPAIGGLAFAVSPSLPFILMFVLWVLAAVFNQGIKNDSSAVQPDTPSSDSLFAGVSFIKNNPAILGTLSLDLFAVLLGGATTLLPVYAKDILQTGPLGLGILRSAPALGALLMTVYLSHFPLNKAVGLRMFQSVIAFGLATVVFAYSNLMWLSLLALFVMGAVDMVSVIIRSSLVQLSTPDDMRGRVNAVNFLFINTSNQLGGFESGMTAALFGTVPAVAIGGVGTVLVALIWMKLFPSLKAVDKLE